MTQYYVIDPEVAGGWGKNMDVTRLPDETVIINKVHYQFDGWLGDALLESTPIFIGTQKLADAIITAGLTGVEFDDVEISKSHIFNQLHPERKLPEFVWFKFNGKPGNADFGVTPELQLTVSQRALELLKEHGLNHADIEAMPS